MHIAIISEPYVAVPPAKYGGTERVIYYLIKGLRELGHTVTLYATGDSTITDCNIIPISPISYPFSKTKAEDSKMDKLRTDAKDFISNHLKEHQKDYDVIHSHGFEIGKLHCPSVTTLHGDINLHNIHYFETQKDRCYVSISYNQRKSFPGLNFVANVYNGLDPEEFDVSLEPKPGYLCFLGRLDRQKNPHLAIHLALKLNLPLKLAGKIDLGGNDYFETECKPYLDNPLIEYIGEIGMTEKNLLLGGALCNLHPTGFREPFGLSVIESAYCGTPTLAINGGSMNEIIEQGQTGMIVEDFAEGYHTIKKCFEMDRNYISAKSRTLFNYKKMAREYVDVYQKAIHHNFH